MCHTHTKVEDAYAAEIEEREQELADWELYYAESEDYDNLSYEERMAEDAAVDRYLDQREEREQEMLEAQWDKVEREMEEQPLGVPTTVTALIHNDHNQLLYVMGSDGQWELPWGPITHHEEHHHKLYTPHEVDSMVSLADMLLSTLGVKVESCQWVSAGTYKVNGDDYEVTLVSEPVVDGVKVMWY